MPLPTYTREHNFMRHLRTLLLLAAILIGVTPYQTSNADLQDTTPERLSDPEEIAVNTIAIHDDLLITAYPHPHESVCDFVVPILKSGWASLSDPDPFVSVLWDECDALRAHKFVFNEDWLFRIPAESFVAEPWNQIQRRPLNKLDPGLIGGYEDEEAVTSRNVYHALHLRKGILYYAERDSSDDTIEVWSMNAETLNKSRIASLGAVNGNITDITSDDDIVYWVEGGDGTGAVRAALKSTGQVFTAASSGIDNATVIAVDSDHVYWGEEGSGRVRRVPKSGGAVQTLYDGQLPICDIALGPNAVYFTQCGQDPGSIQRISKNGADRQLLVGDVRRAKSLNLHEGDLYFAADGMAQRIKADTSLPIIDYAIDRIEVIQSLQNRNQEIDILTNKRTLVRVYPTATGQMTSSVQARLRATLDGQPLTLGDGNQDLWPLDFGVEFPAESDARVDLRYTINFELPEQWIRQPGMLRIEVELNPDHEGFLGRHNWEDDFTNNVGEIEVEVTNAQTVCLITRPLATKEYPSGFPNPVPFGPGFIPKSDPMLNLFNYLDRAEVNLPYSIRIYPRSRITPTFGKNYNLESNLEFVGLLLRLQWLSMSEDIPKGCARDRTFISAMAHESTKQTTSPGTGIPRLGLGDIGWHWAIFESEGMEPTEAGGVEFPGTRDVHAQNSPNGGRRLAHENGHSLRRCHVPCGDADVGWPLNREFYQHTGYDDCTIGSEDDPNAFWGYDPLSQLVVSPENARDMMSYGGLLWPSDYTWNGMRAMSDQSYCWRNLGDFLDEISPLATVAEANAPDATSQMQQLMVVNGVLDDGNDGAILDKAWVLDDTLISENMRGLLAEGDEQQRNTRWRYAVRQRLSTGDVITRLVRPDRPVDFEEVALVRAAMRFDERAVAIELYDRQEETLLTSLAVSPTRPEIDVSYEVVEIDERHEIHVTWDVLDADGDELTTMLLISEDDGSSWYPIDGGTVDAEATVSGDHVDCTVACRIRAIVSDGVWTAYDTTSAFEIPNRDPAVEIVEPRDGATFTIGQAIRLEGRGIDAEDGEISDVSLRWSIDGSAFATGRWLSVADLEPGDHRVELQALDAMGSTAEQSVTITVLDTAARLVVKPGQLWLDEGEEAILSIRAYDFAQLYGGQIEMKFDPAVVEVVDLNPSQPGAQIEPGDFPAPDRVFRNVADNNTGSLHYYFSLEGESDGVSGQGTIAGVRIRAKQPGSSWLAFSRSVFSDPRSRGLDASSRDGHISVYNRAPSPREAPFSISGMIALERRDSNAEADICVGANCASTTEDGSFELQDVMLNDVVEVRHPSYLRSGRSLDLPPDVAGGNVELPLVTLLAGDIAKNDRVDHVDGAEIGKRFNTAEGETGWDDASDITDDGVIDILDIVGVQFNFDQTAPTDWEDGGLALVDRSRKTADRDLGPARIDDAHSQSGSQVRDQSTRVQLEPNAASLGVGDTVSLDAIVHDVESLYAYGLWIGFDPSVVEVVDADDATPGVQVVMGEFLDPINSFVLKNEADNTEGIIRLALTQARPASARTGSGPLGSIRFRAIGEGSSTIEILEAGLADDAEPRSNEIPVTIENAQIEVGPALGELGNISTRGYVGTGDEVMIGGFIIEGGPTDVILRAIGPDLTGRGVPGALEDPTMQLYDASGQLIAENDNWVDSAQAAEIEADALKPADPRESMLIATLEPGAYTAIVRGAGGVTGIALVEVFKRGGSGVLGNISTRDVVRGGDEVMIGGFIIEDQATPIIVRAIGPDLANRGVPGVLGDPTLQLFDSSGQLILENDNWGDSPQAGEIEQHPLKPADPRESMMMVTLEPGAYTAIVRGSDGRTGIALVEVFRVDPPRESMARPGATLDGSATRVRPSVREFR